MSNSIISLDVSGKLFETTLATLSRYPDSMLARMFGHSENGLPAMPKTQNGHYFLEVNPDSFRIILNWLRPGGDVETKDVTKRVLDLSDYFGLQDFPNPPPKPNDELITLNLNGEKEIKILKSTITQNSETAIAKFFNGPESFPPDLLFMLGAVPSLPGCYISAGYNSEGIEFGAGAGRA